MADLANCSVAQMTEGTNIASYTWPNIGPKRTKALLVYALAEQLRVLGGGDYRNANTLAIAARAMQPMTPNRMEAALVGVAIRNANAVTAATIPTDRQIQAERSKLFLGQSDRALDQEILFLLCQIGKGTNA
jgi:hypothetical protein